MKKSTKWGWVYNPRVEGEDVDEDDVDEDRQQGRQDVHQRDVKHYRALRERHLDLSYSDSNLLLSFIILNEAIVKKEN